MLPLTKRDVELMVSSYDEAPIESLLTALCTVLGESTNCTWNDVVGRLPFGIERTHLLLARDQTSLDNLLQQLVEFRGADFL